MQLLLLFWLTQNQSVELLKCIFMLDKSAREIISKKKNYKMYFSTSLFSTTSSKLFHYLVSFCRPFLATKLKCFCREFCNLGLSLECLLFLCVC